MIFVKKSYDFSRFEEDQLVLETDLRKTTNGPLENWFDEERTEIWEILLPGNLPSRCWPLDLHMTSESRPMLLQLRELLSLRWNCPRRESQSV